MVAHPSSKGGFSCKGAASGRPRRWLLLWCSLGLSRFSVALPANWNRPYNPKKFMIMTKIITPITPDTPPQWTCVGPGIGIETCVIHQLHCGSWSPLQKHLASLRRSAQLGMNSMKSWPPMEEMAVLLSIDLAVGLIFRVLQVEQLLIIEILHVLWWFRG